jgi:DNA-binding PadR family transcriptional regulator
LSDISEQALNFLPLSALDLQVLLVLSENDLYGYAIMKTVEEQSGGVLSPEIGSLYRVLVRLTERGWVLETDPPSEAGEGHRGKPRKYYGITELGRAVARSELRRLQEVVRHGGALGREGAG